MREGVELLVVPVTQMIDEYVHCMTVPRPPVLDGPQLSSFLQAYRCRGDSDAPCLEKNRLHVHCADCDTKPRLVMGCGTVRQDGYIGIDIQSDGADLLWDLRFALPWPPESVAEIAALDILEHVENWHRVLLGWLRALAVGGTIHIRVPDMLSANALRDPTHKNLFSAASLDWLFEDDIYRADHVRRGLNLRLVSRRPIIAGEQTWKIEKLAGKGA